MTRDVYHLAGGTYVVTGGGSGIGRATAIHLAEFGAKCVLVVGRRQSALDETVALAGKTSACSVVTVSGDASTPDTRKRIVESIKSRGGKVNGLINNAGYFAATPLASTGDDEWTMNVNVNLTTPFMLCRELLPFMEPTGASIVNVSSTLAVKPIPNTAAYNATKAALIQLTRTLALELAPKQIRVNAILPAIVETPMYADRYPDDAAYRQGLLDAAKLHPLGRIGQASDIAQAIGFLLSPAASWITGVALPVDGGMLCT